ncbi:MAG: hypothetical protein ACRBDL_05660 [Alphaproteobacteria bacterium]
MLSRLFDYARLALGNTPDQDTLSKNVEYLRIKKDFAEQGICYAQPMYKDQPFDKESERGRVYLNYVQKEYKKFQDQYDFFFGGKDDNTSPPAHE